ncbi:Hypothetical protein AKJ08_2297 [Vulgatibacter incomptus]|uniref:TolA protein n=1 Tax=Vulgatibacter incomptus TaxID=1391653 RepID=A0A0K1PEH1_9BACT|nr:Hypothetical protein AKJ08_2297 [Vulgatibacter incomptus]
MAALVAAIVGWTSRNKLADELEKVNADREKLRSNAATARKAAERVSEDKKGRSEELSSSRDKLREAKKRLHDVSEEAKRSRELANARADEVRQVEQQLASVREENSQLAEELRRRQDEAERPRGRRPEAPVAVAVPVPPPAPVELTPAQVDERLVEMGRKVTEADERVQEAERRVRDAEKRAQESRRLGEEAREEARRAKGRAEANNRVYLVVKGEAELWKAKFGGLEQRWNELWRELEGIGWKPRTPKDVAAPRPSGPTKPGARRGPRRDPARPRRGEGTPAGADQGVELASEAAEIDSAPQAVAVVESDAAASSTEGTGDAAPLLAAGAEGMASDDRQERGPTA